MSEQGDSSNANEATTSTERLFGRVKWFNNRAGYGFITVTSGGGDKAGQCKLKCEACKRANGGLLALVKPKVIKEPSSYHRHPRPHIRLRPHPRSRPRPHIYPSLLCRLSRSKLLCCRRTAMSVLWAVRRQASVSLSARHVGLRR